MTFWNDVRLAARLLLKDKWFTLAAVTALALGIAANNTVFTIVNGVLLRDLPLKDPDRIVAVGGKNAPGAPVSVSDLSCADARDWLRCEPIQGMSFAIHYRLLRCRGRQTAVRGWL